MKHERGIESTKRRAGDCIYLKQNEQGRVPRERNTWVKSPEGGENTCYAYGRKFQAKTTVNPRALK